MDKLVIKGGNSLSGSVTISGAKNAVLPLMAASLLVDGKTTLSRVPNLRDTSTMIRLLGMVGAETEFREQCLTIDASKVNSFEAPYELVKTMRASFYVMGPLLGRFGEARVAIRARGALCRLCRFHRRERSEHLWEARADER